MPGVLGKLPLPQRAKRVIWLTMAGGPSHLETFDPKPKLAEMDGKPMPESFTKGQQLAQLQGKPLNCFGPQHPFAKFGKNQIEICSLFPHIGSVMDDICLIRSMTTDAINHDPAHMFMNTGSQIAGRPSMGAWVTYGLGTEASDLPGFVVLTSLGQGGQNQPIAARQWSSGFLPSKYQGVQLRAKGDPVLYLTNPNGVTRDRQGADVAAINALNKQHGVIKVFNDMKVRKSSTPEEVKKRKKAVLFCLSEDKKNIILEEGKEILVGDVGQTVDDPYTTFVKMLPDKDCRYALYDATYETKESKKEDLVFIFWAPENAPLKSKMIYASSKDAIKKKLTGIKHELQANCYEEVKDRCTLAEKLGGSAVISLEGKPL